MLQIALPRVQNSGKENEPGTRIASRLSLVGKVVSLDRLGREPLIQEGKKGPERDLAPGPCLGRRESTRGLKSLPPAAFLRAAARRPVLFSAFLPQNKKHQPTAGAFCFGTSQQYR